MGGEVKEEKKRKRIRKLRIRDGEINGKRKQKRVADQWGEKKN